MPTRGLGDRESGNILWMSASSAKLVVSKLEASAVRLICRTSRHGNRHVVYFLDSISEHWTIALCEDIRSDFCYVVGTNPKNVCVECRVMNLAECQPIRHDWLAADLGAIWDDVRSMEQLVGCRNSVRVGCQNSITALTSGFLLAREGPEGCH